MTKPPLTTRIAALHGRSGQLGGIFRTRAETGLADCHASNFGPEYPSSAEKQIQVPAQLRVTSITNGEYMKDLRAHFCYSLLALFLAALPTQMNAQETIYVSSGAGHQILAFSASGTVSGVCNMTFNSIAVTPEDVVVGPDGNIYVADTTGNRIFRVDPSNVNSTAGKDCGAVAIYDQSNVATVCTNPALLPNNDVVSCPTGPEGPSFLRIETLDLYFNTNGTGSTGVWKIPGLANATMDNATHIVVGLCDQPGQPVCASPVQVLSSSSSGEGLDFDVFGKLLAVDQTNGQVIRETVACLNGTIGSNNASCFKSNFISGLSSPVGIAQNACGDVLVASGNAINAYDGGDGHFLSSRSFSGGNNVPRFLEVDSAGRIFLVTAGDESGKNATLFRFDPPANSPPRVVTPPVTPPVAGSCPLNSYTNVFSIGISKTLAAGIDSNNGLGLGISASNANLTASFAPASKGNPAITSNSYVFGAQHSITITCNGVQQPFNLTVTAVKSQPTDTTDPEVTFSSPQFPESANLQCPVPISDPQCLHYGGQHGFCTQYLEEAIDPVTSQPIPDAGLPTFCSATTVSNAFTFLAFFTSAEFIHDPGGAHTSVDVTTNPPTTSNITQSYNECQSQDFYPQLSTGDPVRMLGTNSKHVVFNADDVSTGTISLNSPIASCSTTGGITTCNPQFNIGQNINVKFTLLDTGTFRAITGATEQLSITRTSHTLKGGTLVPEFVPQTVLATKASATLNFFVPNASGQYSYNADSSVFDKLPKGATATYQFTIWGNGSVPFTFFTTGTF